MVSLMNDMQKALVNRDFNQLRRLYKTTGLDANLEEIINRQVLRIQQDESSLKNSNLFITILLETKDLEESFSKLLRIIFDATKNMPQDLVKPTKKEVPDRDTASQNVEDNNDTTSES